MARNLFSLGDPAPQFTMKDVFGTPVSLTSQSGSHVLLAFLRYANCPFCNLTIHRLAMEYPLLRRNKCSVIAFMQSDNQAIIENIYERHAVRPPFPIVADPDKHLFNQYGVKSSVLKTVRSISKIPYWVHAVKVHGFKQAKINGDAFLVPALFLVSTKSLTFARVEYGSSLYDHDTFTTIYQPLVFDEES